MTTGVVCAITGYADPAVPGWVTCEVVDAAGRAWTFVEKVPIVTAASLGPDSAYPQPGVIACAVVARRRDPGGRALVTIDTDWPWGIAATTGEVRFEVDAQRVVAI